MFVATYKVAVPQGRVMFSVLAVLFLVWGLFLRGARQDVVTTLLGLAVCYGLVHGRPYRISVKNVAVLTGVFAIVEFMGAARAMFAVQGVTIGEIWTEFTSTLFNIDGTYHFGTVSPDATTFANTVHLIKSGTMDSLWGWSVLGVHPQNAAGIHLSRQTTGLCVDVSRLRAQRRWRHLRIGRGLHELRASGTLAVPGLISFLMARAFVKAKQKQTGPAYFLLLSFLGMFFR